MPPGVRRFLTIAASLASAVLVSATPSLADPPAEPPSGPQGVKLARSGRVPLLPEGVVLQGAVGTIDFDGTDAVWLFRPRVSEAGLGRVLVILPGEVRTDLSEVLGGRAGPAEPAEFEVFGRVYAHRGRNYLLASAINRLEPPAIREPETKPAVAPAAVPANPAADDPFGDAFLDEGDDLAARLESELEAQVGRAPRSVAVDRADAAAIEVREQRIHRRRGHLRRDVVTGTLLFVPEADGTGARDPQYELLPCRELERLEAFAARPEAPRIIRISGLAIEEGSRRFLLPSAFTTPREGRGIAP